MRRNAKHDLNLNYDCSEQKSKERKNQPNEAGSLQPHLYKFPLKTAAQRILFSALLHERAPRASLTVEAAAAVPMFLMAMVMMLSILELYRMQAMLTVCAQESAMRTGMYAYLSREKAGDGTVQALGSAAAGLMVNMSIPEEVKENGRVSVLGCRSSRSEIDIQITYEMPVWFPFFPVSKLRTANRGYVCPWTGWNGELAGENTSKNGSEDEMVYVAENGSVYHTSEDCTHIHLTILQTTKDQVGDLRNDSGSRYSACEKCIRDTEKEGILYVSPSGNRYHTSLACSGLKRTVKLVKQSEISEMEECGRCREKEGG